jgi:putative ABC transport system permease protein
MNVILQSFMVAFKALMSNKTRSALTMLGIIIGVASVITLMSIGKGAQAAILPRIETLGANHITIRPGAVTLVASGVLLALAVH